MIKGYNFHAWQVGHLNRLHVSRSPLVHMCFYIHPEGRMNKRSLELNFSSTSFIWPLICNLVYKHHILHQALVHVALHHSDSAMPLDRQKSLAALLPYIGRFLSKHFRKIYCISPSFTHMFIW